jgi:hypothetical protein
MRPFANKMQMKKAGSEQSTHSRGWNFKKEFGSLLRSSNLKNPPISVGGISSAFTNSLQVTPRAFQSAWQLAIVLLLLLLPTFAGDSLGQRRRSRSRPAPTSTAKSIDYSKFSHATTKHQLACNKCHKGPTSNWQKVRGFPDTADYPDHDACVSCHRPQFFKSPRPPICTVCHSKVSPRDDARFAFRKPDSQRQFGIEFPHDKHQDVIAFFLPRNQSRPSVRFMRASLVYSADDKAQTYNNCANCHLTSVAAPATPAGGWLDNFIADAATFKTSPTSHAACFNCHWKSQEPINNNCAGCHKLAEKPFVVDQSPKRISLKFRHQREQHIAECTTCHINITKVASLRGLKPDVPITSCTECHNKDGLRLDLNKELEALDKNGRFVCVYCHTSDKGRLDPPPGHYSVAGRAPIKRQDLK